jgi:hypothetical protein
MTNIIRRTLDRIEALEKRIEALEKAAEALQKPCTYEMRPMPDYMRPTVTTFPAPQGTWCQTHGWNCPNAQRPRP